jgi:glycosyltransferase involved in cell wall biosynthesis
VLESLAARVPAIITTACHFPELAEAAAGIVCEPDVKSIGEALHLMKNEFSAEDRRQIAECGRELVEDRYTWESQARRLLQVYRWIEKGSAKPDFVE